MIFVFYYKTFFLGWYETQAKYKNLRFIFTASGNFPGKLDSVILLGLECTINLQNLMKIVRAIFEKMKILIFYFRATLGVKEVLQPSKFST